jgi:DNA-directed RNA polymerase specialized sigma24 family protein
MTSCDDRRVTDERLWVLFRAVARGGDEAAWPTLLAELEPEVLAMARRQPIGRLRRSEDSPREIVTRVFARLHARDQAAIHKLCAYDPQPELRAWLRVLVRRSAIDYMRESPEFERATAVRPNRWVSLASLSSGAPAPEPSSIAGKRDLVMSMVRDMVDRARAEYSTHGDEAFTRLALEWKIARIHVRRLATRGAEFIAVLTGVFEGRAYPEIAEALAITRREVELTVRYLEELMQARFNT